MIKTFQGWTGFVVFYLACGFQHRVLLAAWEDIPVLREAGDVDRVLAALIITGVVVVVTSLIMLIGASRIKEEGK